MLKCGVDITEISRIRKAIGNRRFVEKVFTNSEIEYFNSSGRRAEILAGFFAAKEAFSKCVGTGFRGFGFLDIEICHNEKGAPFLKFKGRKSGLSVSISHEKTNAVAVVFGNDFEVFALQNEKMEIMKKLLPKRADDANKCDCGRVFIVAGSEGMTGAATLTAYSALRCGSGLVTVGTPESERQILACKLTEAMTVGLPQKNGVISMEATGKILEYAKKANSMVIGPGIGKSKDIFDIICAVLENFEGTLIIDADGINAISRNIDILKKKRCRVVLTPHAGEMERLTGIKAQEIQKDRGNIAKDFAARFGVCVVLKGKETVIAGEDGNVTINPTGNCGMATGGAGDVLAGVISAFAAQGKGAYDAAVLGAYVHGMAGDIAKEDKGIYGLIAGDVVKCLPYAIKCLSE